MLAAKNIENNLYKGSLAAMLAIPMLCHGCALSVGAAPSVVGESGEVSITPVTSGGNRYQSVIERAQQFYVANNIAGALDLLTPWIKLHPTDAAAHYLQANCLLKANRRAEASYEYARTEQLAPSSKLAEYCRTAQARLSNMQSTKPSMASNQHGGEDEDEATETSETADTTNSTERASGRSGNQTTKLPPGTLELIRKQAAMARRRAVQDGAAEADAERVKAATEAKSLQEKAERLAGRSRNGNEPIVLSPEEKERLRSQSAASTERLKELGEIKAAQAEEGSKYKAEEIQRQADNLQEQLLNERAGGSKLNPVGTNLYIRNYSKPPVAAMRTQVQMKSLSKDTDVTLDSRQTSVKMSRSNLGKTAGQRSAISPGNGSAVTSVKGKVLDMN